MSGFVAAEMGHIVNLVPPVDISGGVTGAVFNMENWDHATIIVQIGASAAAFTKIIVNECNTQAAGDATAIAHYIYKEETATGDTLGARTAVLAAGTTPSANDNIFYVIELDASELRPCHPYVQLALTNGVNSVIASAVAILSGGRFAGPQTPTVLA